MKSGIVLPTAIAVFLFAFRCGALGRPGEKAVTPSPDPELSSQSLNTIGQGKTGRPVLERRTPRYQLHPGDILDLFFPLTPEFDQTVTVQPDGYIALRGVGDLHAGGQTAPELTQALQAAYQKILHDPVITLQLKDFEKPYFVVAGEVEHPGKFDLRGDTTLTQAVAIAGGLNETARHSQVLLFRRTSDDWVEVKKINLKEILQGGHLREDVYLRPGDMMFVPKNAIARIKRFIPSASMGLYFNPRSF